LKDSFDELPGTKLWDHAVELAPDASPKSCKVYPLSASKQKELDAFLKKNLDSGQIRPSKSPMAAPVFFVKKKDILIFTETLKEHWKVTRRVLELLEKHKLYLRPDKCEFEKTTVKYLGVIISHNSVSMDPVKIASPACLPLPLPLPPPRLSSCKIRAEGRGTGCRGAGRDRDMRRDGSLEEN